MSNITEPRERVCAPNALPQCCPHDAKCGGFWRWSRSAGEAGPLPLISVVAYNSVRLGSAGHGGGARGLAKDVQRAITKCGLPPEQRRRALTWARALHAHVKHARCEGGALAW